MNNLIKRNGNAAAGLESAFDTFFGSHLRRFMDGNFWERDGNFPVGTVPVNLRELEHAYEMDVVAPGCKKEDFSVSVHQNLLTVSFEKKEEAQKADEHRGWSRHEFIQQSFKRSFSMDDTVDAGGITATYTDGILRLTIPKSTKAKEQNRLIEIQ